MCIKETTVRLAWHLASIVQLPRDDLVTAPLKKAVFYLQSLLVSGPVPHFEGTSSPTDYA